MAERISDLTHDLRQRSLASDFSRWLSCVYDAEKFGTGSALEHFERRFPYSPNLQTLQKAAVAPGTSTDAAWAGPLALPAVLQRPLIELLNAQTVIGRLESAPRVPFRLSVPVLSSPAPGHWVTPGSTKPMSALAFSSASVPPYQAAVLVAVTEEVMRLSNPSAERIIPQALANSLSQFLDAQFLDPAVAAVANVNPASITNGLTPLVPSTDPKQDFLALLAALGPGAESLALIGTATNLAAMGVALGAAFTTLVNDVGLTVISTPGAGDVVVLLDQRAVLIAEGPADVHVARHASAQMDSAPTTPLTPPLVSFWQQNLVGLRAERLISWTRASDESVAFLDNVAYATAPA